MLADQVVQKLTAGGYQPVQAGKLPCRVLVKREEILHIVCVIDNAVIFRGQMTYLDGLLFNIEEALERQLQCSGKVLALIISDNVAADRELTESRYAVWFVDSTGRRIVFDNQPGTFGNVEQLLEQKQGIRQKIFGDVNGFVPWVTLGLVLVNVLVQIVVALQEQTGGDSALFRRMVLAIGDFRRQPEYYRVLSSAFLHFGWRHLFNNMLVLLYLGKIAEKVVGRLRFGIAYLICAAGAGAASAVWYSMQGEWMVSTAGASGAVFGIAGMMLFLVLLHRGHLYNVSTRQITWMIIFTIYNGMSGSGVNNCAHIVGAVLGFLFGILWWLVSFSRTKEAKA